MEEQKSKVRKFLSITAMIAALTALSRAVHILASRRMNPNNQQARNGLSLLEWFQQGEMPRSLMVSGPADEITMLKNLAEILNQTLPPEKALGAGLEMVAEHVGASIGWILELTPDSKSRLAASYRLPPQMELANLTDQPWELCNCLRESLEGRLNSPIRVYNCERLKNTLTLPENEKHHLSVPIRASGRPVGILNLVIPVDVRISDSDVRLISALGDQFGGAVERARLFNEVQKLAITDPLTGLYNRRYFYETAFFELERSLRYKRPLALAILDIDKFKQVNDTYGHLAGDQVLRILSEVCLHTMRRVDIIGRFGGEELVILMPETAQEQAHQALERLRHQVEQKDIQTIRGVLRTTISVGVASATGNEHITFEELLDRADRALYTAKNHGRNQVRSWNTIQTG